MAGSVAPAYYFALTTDDAGLRDALASGRPAEAEKELRRKLGAEFVDLPFKIIDIPSSRIRRAPPPDRAVAPVKPFWAVVVIRFCHEEAHPTFDRALRGVFGEGYSGLGVNLPVRAADSWCPGEATLPLFGSGGAAEELIRAEALEDAGLTGRGVNALVVDHGINAKLLPAGTEIDGWMVDVLGREQLPGKASGSHGSMVARNLLRAAPDAKLFDCPILPESTGNVPADLAMMHAAYLEVRNEAPVGGAEKDGTRWVIVNAWSVYDLSTDRLLPEAGRYATSPEHPIHKELAKLGQSHDIVFCAGNCGRFCPHPRCGAQDRGPGRSIHGANSHPDVLTVGAVRVDGFWLGYSAEGPGQPALEKNKPDLCAPSQFGEDGDARTANTGTSAASGVAAGVVAALRGGWSGAEVSPAALRACLRDAARPVPGSSGARVGSGILDAERALACLTERSGAPRPIVA